MTDEEIQKLIIDYLEKGAGRHYLDEIKEIYNWETGEVSNTCTDADIDRNLQILIDRNEVLECAEPEGPGWYIARDMQPGTFDHEFGWKKWGKIIEEGDCITLVKDGVRTEIQVCNIEFGERTVVTDADWNENYREFTLEDYEVVPEGDDHKIERLIKEEEEERKEAEALTKKRKAWENAFDALDRDAREKVKSLGHDVVFGPGAMGECVKCGKYVQLHPETNSYSGTATKRACGKGS